MSENASDLMAEVVARLAYTHRARAGMCTCGERLRAPSDSSHARHLGQLAAADILAELARKGYVIVKLPEPQFYQDDERGDIVHFNGSSHSYFPEPGGRITDDSNSQVWESASDAKEDAAALLAAVSEAEK